MTRNATTTGVEVLDTLDATSIREAANVPAVVESATDLAVPVTDEWQQMAVDFDDGSAAFIDHFGLTMPRLRSDFGRNGKGWVDDLTGEVSTLLRIVILAQPPSRTFWIKSIDEGEAGPPDCKSTNLLTNRPDEGVPDQQSAQCSTCPHAQWGEAEDGSPVKPRCSEAVNVLAYDLDGDRFMWLAFRGKSISPFRKYVSALYSRKMVPFAVETKVTLEEAKRGSLSWLEARFAIGDPLTPDLVRPLREMAKRAMATWGDAAEDLAAQDAADAPRRNDGAFKDEEPF